MTNIRLGKTFTFHYPDGEGTCDVGGSKADFARLYEALSKTNQEPVVREFLEAIRPGV